MDDNIFVPIKNINNLRRDVISLLKREMIKNKKEYIKKDYDFSLNNYKYDDKINICFEINNEDEYNYLKKYTLYTTNYLLYLKHKDIIYRNSKVKPFLINETSLSNKISSIKDNIMDYGMNIANSYSLMFLLSKGAKRVTLSLELS